MSKTKGEKLVFRYAGERGLLIEFGQDINPEINARVRAMAAALEKNTPMGVTEIIPAYRSLLLTFDPLLTHPERIKTKVKSIDNILKIDIESSRVVKIPVCYSKEYGPDMENVKDSSGLNAQEIIKLHSQPEYLIYMIGFTPGFAFLGGLNRDLFTPRLETPRMAVPEGSVGIANNQTGMYPITSPGGWQIIGRTPLKLFAPHREKPFLYKAGDKIKFFPISPQEYKILQEQEQN